MKTEASQEKIKPAFKPVKLNIVFEKQEELDTFHAVFNNPHVADAVRRRLKQHVSEGCDTPGEIRMSINKYISEDIRMLQLKL